MIGLIKRGLIYFIVGYLAGLIAWAISLLFADVAKTRELFWFVGVMLTFGFFVGGSVGVVEPVTESTKKIKGFFANFQWFMVGAMFGAIGGFLGAFVGYKVFDAITGRVNYPLFGRICGMFMVGLILGLLVGLVERLRTDSWERFTSVAIAGAFGGAFSGAFRALLVRYLDRVDSLAILLIVFGGLMVGAIAVVTSMRSSAVLLGHQHNVARTPKYGPGYEFLLSADAKIMVGSGFSDRNSAKTQLKIYDDDLLDSIQAVLLFSDDGWYLSPPPGFPDAGEHNYVRGHKITAPTKLKNGDIITLGQTKFYFKVQGQEEKFRDNSGRINGIVMVLLIVAGWLAGAMAVQAQAPQQPTVVKVSFECSGDVAMSDAKPIFYTLRLKTVEFDPQNPTSIKPARLSIANLQNDLASWAVLNERAEIIGAVQSVAPIDPSTPEVVRPTVEMVLAIDLSTPKLGSPLANVQDNPAILTHFLTDLGASCAGLPIELNVSLVLFASDVHVSAAIRRRPISDSDAIGKKVETELGQLLARKEWCYCTALLPALSRSVDILNRQTTDLSVNRLIVVVSDGIHDLTEKNIPVYDCAAVARQNFSATETNAEQVVKKIGAAMPKPTIMFFGTERLQKIGKRSDKLILQRRNDTDLEIPAGAEYEMKAMSRVVRKWLEKRAGQRGGKTTASEWEIVLNLNDTSSAAAFGSQKFYVTFKDSETGRIIEYADEPCLPRFSFMAITAAADNIPQQRLLMLLLALIVLWLLVMVSIYVNYLMVKRRHETALVDGEVESQSTVSRRPPSPIPKSGASGGGYTLPRAPKPKPQPGQRPEERRPVRDRTKEVQRSPKQEPPPEPQPPPEPPPEPNSHPQSFPEPISRPEYDYRPPFPDLDDQPFPDDSKLGR